MDDTERGTESGGRIEVRLLGSLQVRRADGSLVHDRDWKTGKNADLLRWLALQAGDPVPIDVLAEALWPHVDDVRARGSLRTAMSQLRRVLGSDVIARLPAGLALKDAWIDASTFVELAEDVGRCRREGRAVAALRAAREADALYVADVPAGDGAPPAIAMHASALAAVHRRLLGDAAEVAVELGWMRDAVDFATRLLEVDPVSELASRALMLGYAGLGEVHHALQEYERCRRVLADELGVDPSPQTRAAHLQVLQAPPANPPAPAFVGRRSEAAWLEGVLAGAARGRTDDEPPRVVLLAGDEGSGRRRLATVVCERLGLPLVERPAGADPVVDSAAGATHVLLWQPDPVADLDRVARLLAEPDRTRGALAVVLAVPPPGTVPAWDAAPRHDGVQGLELEPLQPDDIELLAGHLLAGPPTAGLVDELGSVSAGLPGRVTAAVREWSAAGRLVATSAGLALTSEGVPPEEDQSGRRALARALPRLDGDALEALLLAAVLDQPVTPALIAPLLNGTDTTAGRDARWRATSALEQLIDLTLLRASAAGAVWRHPLLRDAVHAWMRPATRQRLHRRVAEQAVMASADRVTHWLQAGERELACVAALQAAGECLARGDHGGARTHLLAVCSLGDLPEADQSDRLDLFELLGDTCAQLRRPDEARSAYEQALEVALANMLPDAARLRRKLAAAADPRAIELAPTHRAADRSAGLIGLGAPSLAVPDATLEAALRDAVTQADRKHDKRAAVHARLQLAGAVHLPRREFRAVHEWVEAALMLSPRPKERLDAALVRNAANVLLGAAQVARSPLESALNAAQEEGEDRWWRLLGLRVLVAHDLGEPEFERLWRILHERVLNGPVDELAPELAAIALRVLVEREEFDLALAVSHHLPLAGGQDTLVMEHLARIAAAELAGVTGEHRSATDLLRSVVDGGRATGCTLLVPEAAARLVTLEAPHDRAAARAAFEVFDEVVGAERGGPREEFWRRMSRAAVRAADGDHEGAAAACAQASSLASQHGLQVLAARARRVRAEQVLAGSSRMLTCVERRVPPVERQAG